MFMMHVDSCGSVFKVHVDSDCSMYICGTCRYRLHHFYGTWWLRLLYVRCIFMVCVDLDSCIFMVHIDPNSIFMVYVAVLHIFLALNWTKCPGDQNCAGHGVLMIQKQ